MNRKITRSSEESDKATWHIYFDKILKYRDLKQAWSTVRSLLGKQFRINQKSLLYRARLYANNGMKAKVFVQRHAEISCRESDKDTRISVMDLQCPTQTTRTSPMQQINEDFTPDELQQTRSQRSECKAAGHLSHSPRSPSATVNKGVINSIVYH